MASTNAQTKDLWAIAIEKLGAEDKARLDTTQISKNTALNEILAAVEDKKLLCLQKRWKVRDSSGNVIIVRDLVDKVAVWIKRFIEVGDVAVQYDPSREYF